MKKCEKSMFWIGLQCDESIAKWAKVSRKNEKISIDLLRSTSCTEQDSLPFPKTQSHPSVYRIVSGIEAKDLLLRELSFDLIDRKKIATLLPFQIESYLPYPQEEAIISSCIYSDRKSKSSTVFCSSVRKTTLKEHIDFLANKNLDPYEVSSTPTALWRFSRQFLSKSKNCLVLHGFGASISAALIVDQKLVSSIPLYFNEDSLIEKECQKLFTFLEKKINNLSLDLILTGSFMHHASWREAVFQYLPPHIQFVEIQGSETYDALTLATFAVPIGLAIDGMLCDGHSTELRKGEFTSITAQQHKIRGLLRFTAANFLITILFSLISLIIIHDKKQSMAERFALFFPESSRTPSDFYEFQEALDEIDLRIARAKIPYLLSLPLPSVSETLAWISSYLGPQVNISKITYELISYPTIFANTRPYQARVELDISPSSPQAIEDFKKFLRKESSLSQIDDHFSCNETTCSFFLKHYLKKKL